MTIEFLLRWLDRWERIYNKTEVGNDLAKRNRVFKQISNIFNQMDELESIPI